MNESCTKKDVRTADSVLVWVTSSHFAVYSSGTLPRGRVARPPVRFVFLQSQNGGRIIKAASINCTFNLCNCKLPPR